MHEGREGNLERESASGPRRVVSLQPSVTLTLARLGTLDRLAACTRYCRDVCPEAAEGGRRIVQDSWSATAEEILAAKPDLVIASVPYRAEALAEILKAGVPFLALAPHSLDDVFADIALIAGAMQVPERGTALIAEMRREIAEAGQRARRAVLRPRVFCEEWGKPVIHSQRWVKELVEIAGGEFVGEPGKQAPADAVRDADPEVMIFAWCGAGDRVPLEKVIRERRWDETSAARTGRVFCLRDELLNTPGPSLVDGLRALAWCVHPEIFAAPESGVRGLKALVIK
ncbi:MAG TPA: ABC transporter substrate-binding protein [Terriglobales bacterium]|nr:ABC transporter substrate-binding protein [Terriglobales bacterium]